jgi:uncharacterized protein with HEPN domain
MGEAAGKVDNELKNLFYDLPWRQMSDLIYKCGVQLHRL